MRLLIDAQLPPQPARYLAAAGDDAVDFHDLHDGVSTPDAHIAAAADAALRVVVTKGADFRQSHLVTGSRTRLLLISTGNIRTRICSPSAAVAWPGIDTAFGAGSFVELHRDVLIVHGFD